MKLKSTVLLAAAAIILPLAAQAQNVAIVNGKPVPKSRLEPLLQQASRAGQPVSAEMESRARDEVVLREIFAQEAERRGIPATAAYKAELELMRQTVLIRALFEDFQKKNSVNEADARAEYDRIKAASSGTEYRARHILVESEDTARKLIADLKAGAKFEDLAKANSKDPGSAENGGDLDFAKPEAYVPEFGKAMAALKKGEYTLEPVKTQFGFHVILLEDQRETQFPGFDDVKGQLLQRMGQKKLQQYQEDLRKAAKTDYKFSAME
ncbi:Peptidylprolyl isomerase peptidyl-prolyl cis-trans isomerase [Vitreoscilla filiformis]|jgi:peptidyl-prolyl cis-trans isomerase C|uniref:peptidylprolyl isomerase n=1 Tax=Vitreoscilla filiformis TaxID=63 RepID=A0A221KGD7_VITFI|nr:peptidylprolyl isomerase [Vitreoscilla filiformis]ASM78086.1 Peptidylprolyl isomerase peptidyl-prolyl cis-trans isomerase [Vitreoscilla filiformis]